MKTEAKPKTCLTFDEFTRARKIKNTLDDRHQINKEWIGKPTRQFVFRFCSYYINSFPSYKKAQSYALEWEEKRRTDF